MSRRVSCCPDYPENVLVREVSVDELESAISAGATVVDVREDHEFNAGRVPGARSVPMGTVPEHLDEFPAGVYVICQSGGRSARVCEFLAEHGVEGINVAGGTGAWIRSGRPIDVGDAAT